MLEQQLLSVIDENRKECWLKWLKKFKEDFPNYELVDKNEVSKSPNIGIRLYYNNISFLALIE